MSSSTVPPTSPPPPHVLIPLSQVPPLVPGGASEEEVRSWAAEGIACRVRLRTVDVGGEPHTLPEWVELLVKLRDECAAPDDEEDSNYEFVVPPPPREPGRGLRG